jgi:hypothetical protein
LGGFRLCLDVEGLSGERNSAKDRAKLRSGVICIG